MSNAASSKYILYGASFDPPHIGHLSAISQMLEQYDYIIIFPLYNKNKFVEEQCVQPLSKRIQMLQLFLEEFFPKIKHRLFLINLKEELKNKERGLGSMSLYEQLTIIKEKLPSTSSLSFCIGTENNKINAGESEHDCGLIEKEFSAFTLKTEVPICSKLVRANLSNQQHLKSKKNKNHMASILGSSLFYYIQSKNLYGSPIIKSQIKKPI